MPMNVNRWLLYAKAKLDETLRSSNEELDRLELEQEAERVDRPWLAADSDAPSIDEARARIKWEAERAEREAAKNRDTSGTSGEAAPGSPQEAPAERRLPTDPLTEAEAAERSAARIELDARAKASAQRLEDIRKELGVADPTAADPDAPADPTAPKEPPPGGPST